MCRRNSENRSLLRSIHFRLKGDFARLACGQANYDHLIDRAGKDFARVRTPPEVYSTRTIAVSRFRIAAVVLDGTGGGKCELQIADGFIRHLTERLRHDFVGDELHALSVFAIEQEAANFGQCVVRI